MLCVNADSPSARWISETAAVLEAGGVTTLEKQQRIWALADRFSARTHVREVVPGMNNLCVELDPESPGLEQLPDALLREWSSVTATSRASRRFDIPVEYGGAAGPDLDEVARHSGLSPAEVVRRHCATEYTVYFLGFLPGFAYLGGLDARLVTPRRREPRLAVPAGSVGIGGEQTGIYPWASPGGWQLIGRTSVRLFDPTSTSPAVLSAGDTVRFIDARARK
jgi:KipI family sensor histidine kinase inhibitor